jgi:ubiquinone/menaquinone biosynthesis C-methylase UbiE
MTWMLSHKQAKEFYDRFGKKQDWQSFYENIATEALIRHIELGKTTSILEFGCGTGRFAEKLLEKHLPPNAKYVGIDISETMVDLSRKRLIRFGNRAEVRLINGSPMLDFKAGAFDRFISNYVFDLLTFEDIQEVLREAWRVLSEDGLVGLVSLTHGFTPVSRLVGRIWLTIHKIRPMLVGGCRPVSLLSLVTEPSWKIRYNEKFSSYGVPSEVIIAQKVAKIHG